MQIARSGWLLDDTGDWENVRDTDWDTAVLTARLFVRAPKFYGDAVSVNDAQIAGMSTVADLLAAPGWQAADADPADAVASSTTGTATTEVTAADFEFVCDPLYLTAVAVSLRVGAAPDDTDPLLFVFRPNDVIVFGGDATYPGVVKYSTSTETDYLFAFLNAPGDDPETSPGPVEISVPLVDWESAHAAHVWMSPQRANLVANPSFEALGDDDLLFGWRSGDTLARVTGGVGPVPRTKCARLSGSGTKVLESNLFPAPNERGLWSVEAAVAGTGTVRIGLLFWEQGMNPADCGYVCQEFTLSGGSATGGYQVLRTLVAAPDDSWEAQFRLEFDGTECWVDNVLAEPNEAQAGYFDGAWPLGQPDDYSWYGGTGSENTSFSLYYPDRRRVGRYLFGYADTDPVSGVQVLHPGAVEDHVPGGTRVVPHWDDVYHNRSHSWSLDIVVPVVDFPAGTKNDDVTLGTGRTSVTTVAPDGTVATVTV